MLFEWPDLEHTMHMLKFFKYKNLNKNFCSELCNL